MMARILAAVLTGLLARVPLASQEAGSSGVPGNSESKTTDDRPFTWEGFVVGPDGAPAEGALVVTSAGGQARVDATGHYRIETSVPEGTESVQVTAFGRGAGNLIATSSVGASGGWAWVDTLALDARGPCSPSWLPTFGQVPGTSEATFADVLALAVFDDGNGPVLYAGGGFRTAGGAEAFRVARWDGTSWSALGSGFNGDVLALAVYDDGSGPALYAGGSFSGVPSHIARWDGTSWLALGSGLGGSSGVGTVHALTVFDDGNGPALYAGGAFTHAGAVVANRIARWDGSSWSALGSGLSGGSFQPYARALTVHDDGSGPALYAGGGFTTAGGVTANHVARWDGSSWSPLGTGMNTDVLALAEYDDGGGPALYAGGTFTTADGLPASRIARWDGASWSALASQPNGRVEALVVHDDGTGPGLFAAGNFTTMGGAVANFIARWDGTSWSALDSGLGGAGGASTGYALAVYDPGTGPELHVGGGFLTAGDVDVNHVARWNGTRWTTLGTSTNESVLALKAHDDGSGSALYAGGAFSTVGGTAAGHVARWNGSGWSTLGSGMDGDVYALEEYDDGSGTALYAGGLFTTAGGVPAGRIARWDGSSWAPLGSGLVGNGTRALAVFDDGGGTALYAGGDFTTAGGVAASNIARWDGSSWSALGSGTNLEVYALAVFDDGGGPALYAGGLFTTAGGLAATSIARWDGSSWAALGSGTDGLVYALAVFDDGGGPALFAAGFFYIAGGLEANHIARWDGSSWAPLGSGTNTGVLALTEYDDGSGPALYAGGGFRNAGGLGASRIARWDGSSWSALGSGTSSPTGTLNVFVGALTVFDDGCGPALCAGGTFSRAPDSGDSHLARWGGCGADATPPVLTVPPGVFARDVGSPDEVVTFSVTASDCQDPAPVVVCVPPSGSVFPRGTTIVHCTATDASGNQSSGEFPVVVQVRPVRPATPPR